MDHNHRPQVKAMLEMRFYKANFGPQVKHISSSGFTFVEEIWQIKEERTKNLFRIGPITILANCTHP